MAEDMYENNVVAVRLKKQDSFVTTPYISDLTTRAIRYLNAGYPIHLRGAAGTGKTTLAMHVAACFNSPVTIIHGNDEFTTSDLIGSESGYRREKVVDNFIHTVMKTVDDFQKKWVDNQLTVACRNGFTLIYDEFTRSKPETNNILLSVLEEKILETTNAADSDRYLKVHPNFKAIFTSNSDEYAGVHKVQDALLDRMISIDMGYMDAETEREIVRSRSGIEYEDADRIVGLVRELRETGACVSVPSLRAGIMIGKIAKANHSHASKEDLFFRKIVFDVLGSKLDGFASGSRKNGSTKEKTLNAMIDAHC